MIRLNNLAGKPGSVHKRKRLGTGSGSGHGQTSTRGQKGQHSTSGGTKRKGFEGGQMPLLRRIPKSGFNNTRFRTEHEWVNISSLEKNFSSGAEVNPEALVKCRAVKHSDLVKVLGDGLPMVNSAFRAYRYAADHPAFKGRDLTPKGTITERAAQGVDVYRQRRLPGDREAGKGSGDGRRGGREGQRGGGNPDEHPPSDGQREK